MRAPTFTPRSLRNARLRYSPGGLGRERRYLAACHGHIARDSYSLLSKSPRKHLQSIAIPSRSMFHCDKKSTNACRLCKLVAIKIKGCDGNRLGVFPGPAPPAQGRSGLAGGGAGAEKKRISSRPPATCSHFIASQNRRQTADRRSQPMHSR